MRKKGNRNGQQPVIKTPKTFSEFKKIHDDLLSKRYLPIDMLRPGRVRDISLAVADAANAGAQDMATSMGCGTWSNGPLSKVAWAFDGRTDTVEHVSDKDGKPLGQGYVKWGAADNIPSVIPPLAMSSPYTAAPLRYIADLITGLGVHYMYRMPDGELVEFRDAGELLQQKIDELEEQSETAGGGDIIERLEKIEGSGLQKPREPKALQRLRDLYAEWERTWLGYDVEGADGMKMHVPGAKQFLEENNLDLHLSQCMQDHVMLDIYYPTIGLQRGRRGRWSNPERPRITRLSMLPSWGCRLGVRNEYNHINECYFSNSLRTKGAGVSTVSTAGSADADRSFKMYPTAMPDSFLSDLSYIVESNQRTRINARPTWVVCPTFYPSLNKPYYPQPAWWSVFTSKAFDFSATILYDKYKQRDNATTFGSILYVSLDFLQLAYGDLGIQGDLEKQREFVDELDQSVEEFLQHRENTGKMMRQFMWTGPDGKDHKNVEIVDIKETTNDAVKAGKEELELSTSPIFLALQIDPRLVGVPMVAASNGGTALREMHLLKQQQLNIHQRLYERLLQNIAIWNQWSERGEWHVKLQTLTTLDRSSTGVVDTVSGEGS